MREKYIPIILIIVLWGSFFSGNELLKGIVALIVTLYLIGDLKFPKSKKNSR